MIGEGEHLDRERLVDLDQADVVDRQTCFGQSLLGRRDRSGAHGLRVDAGKGERHHAHPDRQAEFVGDVGGDQQAAGGAVGQAGGVAGGDPAVRPERRAQRAEAVESRSGAGHFVGPGQSPALLDGAGGDRHQVRVDLAVGQRLGVLLLAGQRRTRRPAPWSGAGTGRAGSRRWSPSSARTGRPVGRRRTAGWDRRPRPSGGGPCARRRRRSPRRRRRRRSRRRPW